MMTLLNQADANTAYRDMCAAHEAGEHDQARALAGTLRDSIVNGGPVPSGGPVGRVGNAIIAMVAPECAHCGQLMVMAGGLWMCGH